MADSRDDRHKKNRERKAELKQRSEKASRRRKGLAPDQEEVDLAPIWRRFGSLAIDQILLAMFSILYLSFTVRLFSERLAVIFSSFLPVYLFGLLYLVPKISKKGQTFGCKIMKITIIDVAGTGYLSYKNSFLRWFYSFGIPALVSGLGAVISTDFTVMFLFLLFSLGITGIVLVSAIWNEDRQGFHDRLAGSVVVRSLP